MVKGGRRRCPSVAAPYLSDHTLPLPSLGGQRDVIREPGGGRGRGHAEFSQGRVLDGNDCLSGEAPEKLDFTVVESSYLLGNGYLPAP
jgi:hypothetical protein